MVTSLRIGVILIVSSLALLNFSGLRNAAAEPSSGWGIAGIIDIEDKGNAVFPYVVMDSSGNGMAAWTQYDGSTNNIWSCRFTKGVGWGFPEMIERQNEDVTDVTMGIDGEGIVTALWRQSDGVLNHLWSNRYVPGVGWGSPESVESNSDTLYIPNVAVSKSGVAVAVWTQFEGSGYRIWSNTYIPGKGWGIEKPIENTLATSMMIGAKAAVDAEGNAIAIWYKFDGVHLSTWCNIYGIDSGWGDAALLEDNDQGDSAGTEVVFDENGNALASWVENNGVHFDIWCRWYRPGSGWGDAEKLDVEDRGDAIRPDIGFDAYGNAFVIWEQFDGDRYNIWARRYVPGTGWEDPGVIEKDDTGEAKQAYVAVSSDGDAVVAWRQYDGTRYNIMSNRYVKGSGWATPKLIETNNYGDADRPCIVCDRSGNTLSVWHQRSDQNLNIWANYFVRPDITPPVLEISSPTGPSETDMPTVKVTGMTEPGAVLSINGLKAEVADNGSFSIDIALFPGSNDITITSTDDKGNSASKTISVTYNDPLPGLKENITDLMDLISSLSGRIDLTDAEVESLTSMLYLLEEGSNLTADDIASLMENITILRSSLNVSVDDNSTLLDMLSLISERLNATLGEIEALGSEQDYLNEDLNDLREGQDELRSDLDSIQPGEIEEEEEEDGNGMMTFVYVLFIINLLLFLVLGAIIVAIYSRIRGRKSIDEDME